MRRAVRGRMRRIAVLVAGMPVFTEFTRTRLSAAGAGRGAAVADSTGHPEEENTVHGAIFSVS